MKADERLAKHYPRSRIKVACHHDASGLPRVRNRTDAEIAGFNHQRFSVRMMKRRPLLCNRPLDPAERNVAETAGACENSSTKLSPA
jgi:hypothetical protein